MEKPVLVILRGIPGSGKTTFAKTCLSGFVYYDADMFNDPFNYLNIAWSHWKCLDNVKNSLIEGYDIVVANTFTQEWEYQKYIDLAKELDVVYHVLHVENHHGNKSIHDVPNSTIEKMKHRFKFNY